MFFLFVSYVLSIAKMVPIQEFIIGEWDVIEANREKFKNMNFSSSFNAEFHLNEFRNIIEGSIWNDTMSSNTNNGTDAVLGIEDFEIAQLELEFLTDLNGRIFNLRPKRTLMSDFSFTPINFGMALTTKGKINKQYSFQLTLTNGTFFQLYITSHKSSEVKEYFALKAVKPKIPTKSNKYKIFIYIGAFVILLQILLWIVLKCCRSSLDQKLTFAQENTVIDLDKYGELLKRHKEKQD